MSPYFFGLNLGPILLMIENHRSGMLWDLLRSCRWIVDGLRRAGFNGGWLDADETDHARNDGADSSSKDVNAEHGI